MAEVIRAVFTDKGREIVAKKLIGSLGGFSQPIISYFQIGEGGFVETPQGRIPKSPDATKTELEASGDPGELIFQKSFGASDVNFQSPTSIQLVAFLNLTEANDDGLGDPPRFFEIGVFDDEDNMLVYMTFPEETKTSEKTLNHIITITF